MSMRILVLPRKCPIVEFRQRGRIEEDIHLTPDLTIAFAITSQHSHDDHDDYRLK